MKNYLFLEKKYLLPLYPQRGLVITHGKGVYLYDQNGKKYLDMMSNYGVNILGYENRTINKAITNQLGKIADLHGSFTSDVRIEAAQKLIEICNIPNSQLYFSNSGAEAVEAALKFAVMATGKKKFIVMKNNYHGKTLGALSMMEGSKYQKPFLPLLWETISIPFDDVKSLKNVIDHEIAAVILEPIQGEGGIRVASNNYLRQVSTMCQKNGALLIFDEIQSGTGRSGTFLASEPSGVKPSIICLGKGLAGGLPIGMTIVDSNIAQKIVRGMHSSTFGGNPLTCAGIIATLEYLKKHDILEHVSKIGSYFIKQLSRIKSPHIKEVRGKGLMIGVEVDCPVTPILKKMQDNGVLVIPGGETGVRFLPPYIIEKKHVDIAVKIFEKALRNS